VPHPGKWPLSHPPISSTDMDPELRSKCFASDSGCGNVRALLGEFLHPSGPGQYAQLAGALEQPSVLDPPLLTTAARRAHALTCVRPENPVAVPLAVGWKFSTKDSPYFRPDQSVWNYRAHADIDPYGCARRRAATALVPNLTGRNIPRENATVILLQGTQIRVTAHSSGDTGRTFVNRNFVEDHQLQWTNSPDSFMVLGETANHQHQPQQFAISGQCQIRIRREGEARNSAGTVLNCTIFEPAGQFLPAMLLPPNARSIRRATDSWRGWVRC
jgi:hypothetical protein